MKQRNGHTFGVLSQPIDLLAELKEASKRNPRNPCIEVMLQYYMKRLNCNKYKYDHTDSQ